MPIRSAPHARWHSLQAGIVTWMLTGDKQETAINIAISCSLITEAMPLVIINGDSKAAVRRSITNRRHER